MTGLLAEASHHRLCPELSDEQWLRLGTRRVLEDAPSGRGFLQRLLSSGIEVPERGRFFETLKSKRRLSLVGEVADALAAKLLAVGGDCWSHTPELDPFELFAGDGHFHAAAAHDPPSGGAEGSKDATGHFFSLNLRTHALRHLTVADQLDRRKEHDMRALKRLSLEALRQGVPKGRKVLIVWDRAGIDFAQWHHWKHTGGIYFISREKENMKLEVIGVHSWDRSDSRNKGVLDDQLCATSQGVAVRRVRYHCPIRNETYAFITTDYVLPPGLIALLYRMRWDIEKVFDEIKNKFGETKAWASSATAKTMQAPVSVHGAQPEHPLRAMAGTRTSYPQSCRDPTAPATPGRR